MGYDYPVGPVSDVRKIHRLEKRVAALETTSREPVGNALRDHLLAIEALTGRVERLEKVLSQVSHAARLLALADNCSALEALDAATLSEVPHDLAGAALGAHARAIEELEESMLHVTRTIARAERLLRTVGAATLAALEYCEESADRRHSARQEAIDAGAEVQNLLHGDKPGWIQATPEAIPLPEQLLRLRAMCAELEAAIDTPRGGFSEQLDGGYPGEPR